PKLGKNVIHFRHTSIPNISFIPCLRDLTSLRTKQRTYSSPEIGFIKDLHTNGREIDESDGARPTFHINSFMQCQLFELTGTGVSCTIRNSAKHPECIPHRYSAR
ncbi:MAG TPA: hypothetical protein VM577_03370, partial [Anaerovoracaceae bacterium]|nr:hypothetical protein [Anaerovoracaceae bacterium]